MQALAIRDSDQLSPQAISSELFTRWTAYIDAKPKTIETYTRAIRQFAKYAAEHGITQPHREDVIAFREELKASGHKPTTVQNYITAVRLFFQWTALEGIYPNIADHVKGAKIDTEHKKDPLTTRQVKTLLSSLDRSTLRGKRDYAIIALMLTTGLRTVSVSDADIADLKAAGDTAALYYRGKGRDEKATYVKLAPPVEDAIREYLAARSDRDATAPLFVSVSNRNGSERMTTRSISRIVKTALVSAGLDSDRLTAHSLRHTTATQNLLNGASLEETQQLLDHTRISTTMIYSHAIERAGNRSEERIAKALFDY